MSHRPTRLLAGVAALAVSAALLPASPVAADPSPSSAAGASWLDADLVENGLFQYSFGGADAGLNVDAGFALLEAGDTEGATAQRDRLEPETDGYITGESFGDEGSTYANATAKLLAFVIASGGDGTSYDGKDLVARLEAQVGDGTEGTVDGEFFDTSTFGNNTNTIGQAFAAQALTAAGSAKAAAVTSHLLAQQCDDGHFPLGFRSDEEDTCDGAANADIAALVITGLRDQSEDPTVAATIRRAADFIASQQQADGSVTGAPPTDVPNANTTGLSAWALGEACRLDEAYAAAGWTRDLQVDGDSGEALAGEVGAIAYDPATLERDSADGISDLERDQYRRGTAQATNGLAYDATATPTVELSAPGGRFQKSGSRADFTVSGIDAGDAPCLVGRGRSIMLDDAEATATATFALPRQTGTYRYDATTGPGTSSATVRVLGAENFKVSVKRAKVRADRKQRVTVRGLTKGESITVRYRGRVVKRAVAKKRTFTTRFDVRAKGKQRVKIVGEFGNRKGAEKFRVVRAR